MSRVQRTIAVVDDDPRVLESLENLFESAGYAVRRYANAKDAIASGFADLDCLITDIGMPGMDGYQLADAAKRARPDLPVFIITGRHELVDHQRGAAIGIAGFFSKPFDGQALLAAVDRKLAKEEG